MKIHEVAYVDYQLVFLTMTDYICTHIHIHSALKAMVYMTCNIPTFTLKVYSLMDFNILCNHHSQI